MTLDRDSEQQQWPQGLWVSGVRGPSSRWPKAAAPEVCVDPPHAGPRPQHQLRPEGALSRAADFCTNK